MQKFDFKEYEEEYHYAYETRDTDKCYVGGGFCYTCMYCFPGHYAVDAIGYNGRDVCMKNPKEPKEADER